MADEIILAELRYEIKGLKRDLDTSKRELRRATDDMAKSIENIEKSTKGVPESLNRIDKEINDIGRSSRITSREISTVSSTISTLKNAALAYLSINFAKRIGEGIANAAGLAESLQGVNLQLEQATGSASGAAEAFEFVRNISQRLGQDTLDNSKQFARMALSAKGTALEGSRLHEVYTGLAEAAAALKVGQEDFNRVLLQVNQGIVKQKFDTEDLKTASENGIPILLALKDALNLSGTELFDAIKDGKIGIEELAKATDLLHERFSRLATESTRNVSSEFRRMFDEVKLGAAEFSRDFLDTDTIKDAVAEIKSRFDDFKNSLDREALMKFFTDLASAIATATFKIVDLVSGIAGVINEINKLGLDLDEFSRKAQGILDKPDFRPKELGYIDLFSKYLGDLQLTGAKATQTLIRDFNIFKQVLSSVFKSLGREVGKDSGLDDGINNLKEAFAGLDDRLKEFVKNDPPLMNILKTLGMFKDDVEVDALLELEESFETSFTSTIPKAAEEGAKKTAEEWKKGTELTEAELKKLENAAIARNLKIAKFKADLDEEELKRTKKIHEQYLKISFDADKDRMAHDKEVKQKRLDELNDFWEIAGRREKEERKKQEKDAKESQERIGRIFERAAEGIQRTFADTFTVTDLFKGKITDIQSFADSMVDIFARAAGEIAASFITEDLTKNIKEQFIGEDGKGGLIGQLGEAITQAFPALKSFNLSSVGGAGNLAASIGLGIGVGSFASQAGIGGGGRGGAAASGAIGGLSAGAQTGNPYAAVAGLLLGGGLGPLFHDLQANTRTEANIITRPHLNADTVPVMHDGILYLEGLEGSMKSPYGDIGVLDFHTRRDDGVLRALSEFDRNLARLLPERLNKVLEKAFQREDLVTQVDGKDPGSAIAELIQTRAYDALEAIFDSATAQAVVGIRGKQGGDLPDLEKRINDAFQIVAIIDEFQFADLTDTGQEIRRIREELGDLARDARVLGLPTDEIIAEQERRIGKVQQNIRDNVTQRLLELSDPIAAQMAALAKQQANEFQSAIEAGLEGSDLLRLQQLHTKEKESLANRLVSADEKINKSVDGVGDSLENLAVRIEESKKKFETQEAAFKNIATSIEQFKRPELFSSVGQNTKSLEDRYNQIKGLFPEDTILPDLAVELWQSFKRQSFEIEQQSRDNLSLLIAQLEDPYKAAKMQLNEQLKDMQKQVSEGILFQSEVDKFKQLSLKAIDEQFKDVAEDVVNEAATNIELLITEFLDPFKAANMRLDEEISNLQEEVNKNLISQGQLDKYKQLSLASNLLDEAVSALSGSKSPIEDIANAFNSFISRGSATQIDSRLQSLVDEFTALNNVADILGLTFNDLNTSFISQAKTIRDELISEVDASTEARRAEVSAIDDFLNSIKLDQSLPSNLRLNEARSQFASSISSGDISGSINLGNQLIEIARERFGSTERFFDVQKEITAQLNGLRTDQLAQIEADRAKQIDAINAQISQVSLLQSSNSFLSNISISNQDTARGMRLLVAQAEEQNDRLASLENTIRSLLRKVTTA